MQRRVPTGDLGRMLESTDNLKLRSQEHRRVTMAVIALAVSAVAAGAVGCGKTSAGGGGGGGGGKEGEAGASGGRRCGSSRRNAGDAGAGAGREVAEVSRLDGIPVTSEVAKLVDHQSAGRGLHHEDFREVGRPREAGRDAAPDRSAEATGDGKQPGSEPRGAGSEPELREDSARPSKAAVRRGRHSKAGSRQRTDDIRLSAGATEVAGAGGHFAASRIEILHGGRSRERHRGRHSGARRRSRAGDDAADDGGRAWSRRGLHLRASRSRAQLAGRPAGASGRYGRAGPGGLEDHIYFAAGRYGYADGAGEGDR